MFTPTCRPIQCTPQNYKLYFYDVGLMRIHTIYIVLYCRGIGTIRQELMFLLSFPFPSLPSLSLPLPSLLHFFPFLPVPQKQGPLNELGDLGSAVSSPSGFRDEAPAENVFGALQSCQKATGGNHFEYSEVHVSHQIDQNLAQVNMIKRAKLDQTSAERVVLTLHHPRLHPCTNLTCYIFSSCHLVQFSLLHVNVTQTRCLPSVTRWSARSQAAESSAEVRKERLYCPTNIVTPISLLYVYFCLKILDAD